MQVSSCRTRALPSAIRLFTAAAIACAALLAAGGSPASTALLPPQVVVFFGPGLPRTGQDIDFSAFATDPNPGGGVTGYAWDFDNNGTTDSTDSNPTLTGGFATPGDHKVKVTVTTTEADTTTHLTAVSFKLVHVHSGNLPPVV